MFDDFKDAAVVILTIALPLVIAGAIFGGLVVAGCRALLQV